MKFYKDVIVNPNDLLWRRGTINPNHGSSTLRGLMNCLPEFTMDLQENGDQIIVTDCSVTKGDYNNWLNVHFPKSSHIDMSEIIREKGIIFGDDDVLRLNKKKFIMVFLGAIKHHGDEQYRKNIAVEIGNEFSRLGTKKESVDLI